MEIAFLRLPLGKYRSRIAIADNVTCIDGQKDEVIMGDNYPYGTLSLTELDGFEPTPLEIELVDNVSFQFLRSHDWPRKWGELVTGRRFDQRKFDNASYGGGKPSLEDATVETEAGPLLPSQAGACFDDYDLHRHLRSMVVFAAKVRRDATDKKDQELLRDLQFWLDQRSTDGFRWDRYYAQSEYRKRQGKWLARIEELKQGTSQVLAILRHRLNDDEMDELGGILEKKFALTLGGADELAQEFQFDKNCLEQAERLQRDLHFPWMNCVHCSLDLRDQLHQRCHRNCQEKHAFLLVDNANEDEVLAAIPREMRELTREVRFTVPRWTFRGASSHGGDDAIFPRFLLLGMEQMKDAQKLAFCEQVAVWMEKKDVADERERRKLGSDQAGKGVKWQVLLKPEGTPNLNALLIAGSGESLLRHRPDERGESLQDVLDEFPMVRVSMNRVTSQGGSW